MTGYDFDKTIYTNDSSVDFFFYMLFSRPYLLIFTPWFLLIYAFYGLKIIKKKNFKEMMFFFVPWHKNIEKIVNKFWKSNANKIQDWYTKQKKDDDIIISASPLFIIKPALDMLNIKNFIATDYNIKTGKISGENCYGEAKRIAFKKLYPTITLDAFYSDSMSDKPMFQLSEKAFLVKKGKLKEIKV